MKRYVLLIAWNKDFRRYGFKTSFRKYFDTIEEVEEYIKQKDNRQYEVNQQWQLKDRESKKVIKEGHTELKENEYGY